MDIRAVDFVVYTVESVDEAIPFYQDTLGLELEYRDDEFGWVEFAAPPTTLAIAEENPQYPSKAGERGAEVAFSVEDVEEALDELREADVEILMDVQQSPVCTMAIIEDPDGNPTTLHCRDDGTAGRRDPLP